MGERNRGESSSTETRRIGQMDRKGGTSAMVHSELVTSISRHREMGD